MPNTVSQSHFAKMCGVSRQAISKAKNEKPPAIKLFGKHVNLDHRITCEYFFTHTGKNLRPESVDDVPVKAKPQPVAKKPKPPRRAPKTKTPVEPITTPYEPAFPSDPDQEPDDGYALPPGIEKFEDITIHNLHLIPVDLIKKIKEFETAAKAKQAREISRGMLIERSVVYKFISQLYTIDVSQIKTQEDRLTPGLCGIFKVEEGGAESIEARKFIKNDSAEMLGSIKRDMDDFLGSLEEG